MRYAIVGSFIAAAVASIALGEPVRKNEKVIVVAEEALSVIDLNAKDVIELTGKARVRAPGVVAGRDGLGREVRVVPQPVELAAPQTAPKEEPQKGKAAPAAKAEAPAGARVGLAQACARCHTKGEKVRASFEMFTKRGSRYVLSTDKAVLKEAYEEIKAGRMPPPEGNNPRPSGDDVEDLRRQAE